MSIEINDAFDVQGPKAADVKMFVGDGQYMDYAKKEDIDLPLRYKGMVVYEMLAGVYKQYRLETGTADVDFKEVGFINNVIETVDELLTLDGRFNTVIVSDLDRGGIFVYNEYAGDDDEGTVFSKWVRQYSGVVNVRWFGKMNLEATWLAAGLVNIYAEVDSGTYGLDTDDIDLSYINYFSYGNVIIHDHSTISVYNYIPVIKLLESRMLSVESDMNLKADITDMNLKAPKATPIFTGIASFWGGVQMIDLPTSDPGNLGTLWNDSGTIKISS